MGATEFLNEATKMYTKTIGGSLKIQNMNPFQFMSGDEIYWKIDFRTL